MNLHYWVDLSGIPVFMELQLEQGPDGIPPEHPIREVWYRVLQHIREKTGYTIEEELRVLRKYRPPDPNLKIPDEFWDKLIKLEWGFRFGRIFKP